MKKVLNVMFLALICYIAFVVLSPIFFRGKSDAKIIENNIETFKALPKSVDKIAILEDPEKSGAIRIELIDRAQKNIDICYHTIKEGNYSASFFNHIFDAADRGVKVRIIIDEMMGSLTKRTQKILSGYPNIELYLYEPLSIFRPWTINNRLHDKMFIVDSEIAITGGRNIADKLYGYDQKLIDPVYDRDFIIKRTDKESVINSMNSYFETLLNLKYVKKLGNKKDTQGFRFQIDQAPQEISNYNFEQISITPEAIMRVSNPQGRMSKAPIIWDTILSLMQEAEKEIIIQSPYIVPTAKQLKALEAIDVPIYYFTNSINTTPNFPAFSSYLISKLALKKTGIIKEYNGKGSIHAKTILIDDDISIIGSFNFDPRSVYLDTESMYIIKSKELNSQLRAIMNRYVEADSATSPKIKTIALYLIGILSFPFRMLV